MHSVFWDISGSLELDQASDLFLKWCFQRDFVFLQDLGQCGCVCSGAYFWSITTAKYLLGRVPLAFPEEELVAAGCLAEPCRWCCGPSQAVSVVDGEQSCHRLPQAQRVSVGSMAMCRPQRERGSAEGFPVGAAAKWGFNLPVLQRGAAVGKLGGGLVAVTWPP